MFTAVYQFSDRWNVHWYRIHDEQSRRTLPGLYAGQHAAEMAAGAMNREVENELHKKAA